ncbi:MAG: gamma-glutamyltransferase [Pseudomonadales bacterium]|nr:gamma-glutamyltransferase [Pseudomonadales bacterium]
MSSIRQLPSSLLGLVSLGAWLPAALTLVVLLLPGGWPGASTVYAKNGMVVTRSLHASEAGVAMMRQGGNAIDAMVAASFALAVTHPAAGNIGGGGFMVIRLADGTVATNDHREMAPSGATRDMFLDETGKFVRERSLLSHLASGVPGSVAGLLAIHERYGRLSRKQVLERAILLAEKGFVVGYPLSRSLKRMEERFQAHPASRIKFLDDEGNAPEFGDVFRQPDLAATLGRIAEEGKDGFYRGKTAQLIAKEMAENGGLITVEDLAAYKSVWREPVRVSYRGYEVIAMGPPSSGGVLLGFMLQALQPQDLASLGPGSAQALHLMTEIERRAFADRSKHLGDPDFYPVPTSRLLSPEYVTMRMNDFDPEHASVSSELLPGVFEVQQESAETTHLSALDRDGNAVSYTTTLNGGYGSGIVVAGAGFLLNNEMDDFSAKPGEPNMFGLVGGEANAIEPSKRMLSSMTPTIVLNNGQPFLVTGSPGGPTIITTVYQIITNVMDHDMALYDAVARARCHHQWLPDSLVCEPDALSADTIRELERMGHPPIAPYRRGKIGDAHSILVQEGVMQGVADPRNDGVAVGL